MKHVGIIFNGKSSGRNSRNIVLPQLLRRVVAIFAMVMMCCGVWGQVNEGFYYIQWKSNTSYYLSVSGNTYATDKPYLKTSTTKDFWLLQKDGDYFYIIHASDGKYVVADYNGTGNKEHAVHLESTSTPGDNALFSITQLGAITPKSNTAVSFNSWSGAGNDIGFYTATNGGSTWNLVSPTPSSGYVIYSGTVYLGNEAAGTDTFNPLTCIWQGNNGGRFNNGTNWLRNSDSFLSNNQNNAQNCQLGGSENGTTGQTIRLNNDRYIQYNSNQFQRSTTASNIVFAVTKTFYSAQTTLPTITGPTSISLLSSTAGTYSHTDAKFQLACDDYVFYNGTHHYCIGEVYKGTDRPEESITYTWSLSDNAAGHATVNQTTGVVSYNTYYDEDTEVDFTLTATSASGKVLIAIKTIVFEAPKENPTSVTAVSPMTVYVGKTGKISYTLYPDPCYENVTFESNNTSVATVAADGTVAGKAVGEATITVKAHAFNSTEFVSTTVAVNVLNQVATPVIGFEPNGTTATATITCATDGATIYYSVNGSDDPTSASTQYTMPFTVNALDLVKAIAVTEVTGWDNSEVASLQYTLGTVPTPTINVRGYEVTFSCDEPGVTYYYTTNGTPPTTSLTPWNGNAFTSSANTTIKVIATKNGFSPSEVASRTLGTAHIVYLDFTNGNDGNTGADATHAKKTWAGAFALLGYGPNAQYLRTQWAEHGSDNNTRNLANNNVFNGATYTSTVDNNIIYLVGDVSESNFSILMGKTIANPSSEYNLMNPIVTSGFFKPVTISGKYANSSNSSTHYARISINAGTKYTLNEDMRFEYVEFYGNNGTNSTDFQMAYYDLEMGEGITCKNFLSTKDFSTYHHGYKQGETNAAHILFYGGISCDKRFGTSTNGALNFDYYLPHPSGYKITIRSGFFSTISPGGTQWDNSTSLNGTMGSPNTPVKCTITVDIDRKWNDDHQAGVLGKAANGNPDCDVAVVIAGVHEGNMYGDVDIIVKSGRIDRVVNGTFGANNFISNHPADSYFGRANILIDPREPSTAERATYPTKNSLVVIRELYGGGLGRFKSSSSKTNQSSTYFYGKSSVTINGGTFKSAIYASGAGGVNGIGDDAHHTNDTKLPYLSGTTIAYGDYTAYKSGTKLNVTCHQSRGNIDEPDFHTNDAAIEETIDLSETSANIQIHGGVFGSESSRIEGIFGGGYGYVDSELIGYTGNNGAKPNTRAGAIFAAAGQLASSVTIDGDAEIYGNVYGAGRGSDIYKQAGITFNSDDYTQLGQVSGNVELTIGGDAKIHGSVYGAGLGINGRVNMARLYGNTTLTVKENAVITGGVYGGGENGIVDQNNSSYGNTVVNIIGGTIGSSSDPANVHGGGYGSQTRVVGSVNLTVGEANATTGATIYGDVYGGSAEGKTNGNTSRTSNAVTNVTLNAGTINGSLYGGGLGTASNPADVYGNVQVTVNGGSVKQTSADGSGGVYGCNNINGKPLKNVSVDIYGTDSAPSDDEYAIYAVYGGGNQADYSYVDESPLGQINPTVTVHNCDNSIEYVYGGGNAADVPNTYVTIYGGNKIGNVFGGGNGQNGEANITGKAGAYVMIYGGTIGNVYGGSNAAGSILGPLYVGISPGYNDEGDYVLCPLDIDNVYGGGNQADSKAGELVINCEDPSETFHIGSVYGGANQANITEGVIKLNITAGNIDNIFGGNNISGNVKAPITVIVADTGSGCGMLIGNVYGGGNLAAYSVYGYYDDGTLRTSGTAIADPVVNIKSGHITGSVFGGGKGDEADASHARGSVVGNPQVIIGDDSSTNNIVTIDGNVFGGGDAANVQGAPKVVVRECETVIGTKTDSEGELVDGSVYGGGNAADLTGEGNGTDVTIWGGNIYRVFGGGNGERAGTEANIAGVTNVKIYGGTISNVFGGSNTRGRTGGPSNVTMESKKDPVCDTICEMMVSTVMPGGNKAFGNGGKLDIGCGTVLQDVYGGANNADIGTPEEPKDIILNITGGKINRVFGGNNLGGTVYGKIVVNINIDDECGDEIGYVYGGGNQANYTAPTSTTFAGHPEYTGNYPEVNIIKGHVKYDVYGGGLGDETGEKGIVTGNPQVKISNNKDGEGHDKVVIGGNVFGGGHAGRVVGKTNVVVGVPLQETIPEH